MTDLYKDFAHDYDEFGAIEDYLGAEKDFFKLVINQYHIKTALDCACGTGQHLHMLIALGMTVQGSDYSEAMLDVAKKNLSRLGINVKLRQCDFRYLETAFEEKFDLIICLTTSLPHLHTDEELLIALKSMKDRLNDNGILVLTQEATHKTLKLQPIETVVNRPDFSRIFIKENDGKFLTIHILDLFHSDNRCESKQYDIKYKILLDDDYRRLLSKAGFTDTKIYGDYDMNDYTYDSLRLIVIAKK